MIDLDKWAAVLTEFTPGMYRRMLGRELLNMDREPFASLKQTYSEFITARPTEAPVLIDPARLRELEADAARYRWLRDHADMKFSGGLNGLKLAHTTLKARHHGSQWDERIDAALQEQPR